VRNQIFAVGIGPPSCRARLLELYLGRDKPVGSFTHDIVREPSVPVKGVIFSDSFEG
jgi:hypothetical protein